MPRLTGKKLKKVFMPDDEDGAWVEIQYLKPGVRSMIDSLSNDISAAGSDGDMETTVKFNLLKKRSLFYEHAIESWGGFLDKSGKETKPTRKNIKLFDEELKDLYGWLQEEMDTFVEETEADEEAEQEN